MGQRFGDGGEEIEERIVDQIAEMTGVQVGETKHLKRELRMLCSAAKQAAPISGKQTRNHQNRERKRKIFCTC